MKIRKNNLESRTRLSPFIVSIGGKKAISCLKATRTSKFSLIKHVFQPPWSIEAENGHKTCADKKIFTIYCKEKSCHTVRRQGYISQLTSFALHFCPSSFDLWSSWWEIRALCLDLSLNGLFFDKPKNAIFPPKF